MYYANKINITLKNCPRCLSENVTESEREEELPIKDDWNPVTFILPLVECKDCNKTSPAIEARKAIHDASCIAMGVLPPNEIISIRKKRKLSAEQFAKILGLGLSTVKRWESRSLFPTKSNMTLVKLFRKHGPTIFNNLDEAESAISGDIFNEKTNDRENIFSKVYNTHSSHLKELYLKRQKVTNQFLFERAA